MATLTIRNLEEKVVDRLKARAAANHRSLEAELRQLLSNVANEPAPFDFRAFAARVAAMTPKGKQPDSVKLLREDRRR
jgi:plasmid stability protein